MKINLGVGAYRDKDGNPLVLPSVRVAEERLLARYPDKEYAPIAGYPAFLTRSVEFAYGESLSQSLLRDNRLAVVQTLSGTGALRLAADFLKAFLPSPSSPRRLFLPNPTWPNHLNIARAAGLEAVSYPYYNPDTQTADIPALLAFLRDQPTGSLFLFHACAHNPTGCDPSPSDWDAISATLRDKRHTAILDCAYQASH